MNRIIPLNRIEAIKQKPDSIIDPCGETEMKSIKLEVTKVTKLVSPIVNPSTEYVSTVTNYGNWSNGFSVTLYKDLANQVPMINTFIGSDIHVKVEWNLRFKKLQFYVRDCEYVCAKSNDDGNFSLDIIKVTY